MKIGRLIRQCWSSLRPQSLRRERCIEAERKALEHVEPPTRTPSARYFLLASQVPPPPPFSILESNYPSANMADTCLAKFVANLRELALVSPDDWGHAAVVADRLEGHAIEDIDRASYGSILQELRGTDTGATAWREPWLYPLNLARSYGDVVDAWLKKNTGSRGRIF